MNIVTNPDKMDFVPERTLKLRNFISEITFKETEQITEDTLLFEEGIFDSLGFLSLISFLNENFGIEVESDELNEENFATIKSIITFISTKLNVS